MKATCQGGRATGRVEEARRIHAGLLRRAEHEHVSPVYLGLVLAAIGDHDEAFRWLDRAYDERAGALRFVRVDALFRPFRGDVRYAELLRRMRLD